MSSFRRRMMMAANANKQAEDYIQDGLIGWFDGNWNEDIGIHNPNATSWVNLANKGVDITNISTDFTWGQDYLLPPIEAGVGTIPNFSETIQSIEVVITFSGTGFLVAFSLANNNRTIWLGLRGTNTVNFSSGGKSAPCLRGEKVAISGTNVQDGTSLRIYINGDEKVLSYGATGSCSANTFNSTFSWGRGTAYIYCIRFYNRVLTEQEVIHNYNIDKSRFNLL